MNPFMYRQNYPIMPYPIPAVLPQRRETVEEEDLETITLQIQKKRFYVDVKKNWRGRFMKIAEVGTDGRKSRILLTMTAADDLKDKLLDLVNVYDDLIKKNSTEERVTQDNHDQNNGVIKSHILNYPHRRYYLDLKENQRGFFLRLTMLSTGSRVKLGVPAEGIREMYNAINDLLQKWCTRTTPKSEERVINLPEPKAFRLDNRTLYFDSVSNRYGVFLRISQVWSSSRTAITIPGRSLSKFREIIDELADSLSSVALNEVGSARAMEDNEEQSTQLPEKGSPELQEESLQLPKRESHQLDESPQLQDEGSSGDASSSTPNVEKT